MNEQRPECNHSKTAAAVADVTNARDGSLTGVAVVGFSGGKDSVVLRQVLAPIASRLLFAWVTPGATLPHMREFILQQGVIELRSNQAARFQGLGLPSRVIPIHNTPAGLNRHIQPARPLLADWISCCVDLRWRAAFDCARRMGHSVLVNGQRGADGCERPVSPDPALTVLSPLWDLTDAEIAEYIEAHQLTLPQQYAAGYFDSLECWNCTAEVSAPQFQYLRANHPESGGTFSRGCGWCTKPWTTRSKPKLPPKLWQRPISGFAGLADMASRDTPQIAPRVG